MRQRSWNLDHGPLRGFYRDRENGWIFGVCAGLADRFNLNLCAVRAIAFVSLLVFTGVTALAYVLAVLLIREKPLLYSGRDTEYDFWRRHDGRWRHS